MSYNIIQWSSGNVGKHSIATIAQRVGLNLVGVFVYNPNKDGIDASEIAGVERTGVAATCDRQALLEMEADCVIHCPLPSLIYGENPDEDLETICALLASGKNVITTVGYMYPKVYGAQVLDRLNKACEKGSSSFHGTGVNPGWLGDVLPLMMSGICQKLDKIHVREISNFEFYASPEIVFDMMGFGRSPKDFEQHTERYKGWLSGLFRESIQMVADGLRLELDDIAETFSFELTEKSLDVAAGTLPKGTVAGQHWEWAGIVDKKKIIVHETVWRMHESVGANWPSGNHSISIQGRPDLFVEFGQSWNNDVLLSTAVHAVNAVPYVCEARPGIRTFLDLPMIMASEAMGTGG